MDKSTVRRSITPKGKAYCDKPGTSCYYDLTNHCVNCLRPKGWRQSKFKALAEGLSNGQYYSLQSDGHKMLCNKDGTRSIFDDVDL